MIEPVEPAQPADAVSHAAVDAVLAALGSFGIEPHVRWFDSAVTTAALAAEALEVAIGQIANSLIFNAGGTPLLILTSGAHRVDTEFVGEQLGLELGRADKDFVKAHTGQTIGGVAPIGHPAPIRSFVDVELEKFDTVWAAAGHPKSVYRTSYAELLRVTGGSAITVEP